MNLALYRKLFFFSLIAMIFSRASADDNVLENETVAQFRAWDRREVPGGAVAVVRDGHVVLARGFGVANLDDGAPITTRSIFELGSIAKSFTCAATAVLLDQGKISPDDSVDKYLPEIPPHDPPILVRHLIRCESGFPDYWFAMQLAGWNIEDAYNRSDVLELLARWKTMPPAGSCHSYNSSDYVLLGLIIERVSGQSMAEFTRKNLFEPLQMTRTYFEDDPTRPVVDRVVGYDKWRNGRYRRWAINARVVGGSGLKSCIEDLVRWLENFESNRLPRGFFLDRFFATGTLLDNRNVVDMNPTGMYRGQKRIQFTGGMPGFQAVIARYPDQRFAVVCLSNSDLNPFTMAQSIADRHLETHFSAPTDPPPRFASLPVSSIGVEDLQNKVGDYELADGRIWTIRISDGMLICNNSLRDVISLEPLSEVLFRARDESGDTFLFRRETENRSFSLTISDPTGWKSECRRVALVSPSKEVLGAYTGAFFNEELLVYYRFSVRDGALHLQVNNRGWERLDPTTHDRFIPHARSSDDNRIIQFSRNESGQVDVVTVKLWRVKGIQFQKMPDKR